MFHREKKSVLSCSMAQREWLGMLEYGIRALVFNTEPGWSEQVDLKRNFIED
jgi:hypothetical protein